MAEASEIVRFWELARGRARLGRLQVITGPAAVSVVPPPAWSFGSTPAQADELLALVLSGRKTATASALESYEAEGVEPPRVGDLSIVLDGAGHPRALVRTTAVDVVPFDQVGAEHAAAEGEGDLSLDHWRAVHAEAFSAELAEAGRRFRPDSPVVLERLRLLHPRPREVRAGQPVGV